MPSISVRVDDEIKLRLDTLAKAHGLNVSWVLREVIVDRLEELEDVYEASVRLARPHRRMTDTEVWATLNLVD